jgi:hypothetical protein
MKAVRLTSRRSPLRRPGSAPPPPIGSKPIPGYRRRKKAPRAPPTDPLAGAWDSEIVPMLEAAPGVRAVAIFEEICRRHPEIVTGVRAFFEPVRVYVRWGPSGP